MGKFKPMSKMETTEPSVELKLKKGGKVKKMQMGGRSDIEEVKENLYMRPGENTTYSKVRGLSPAIAASRLKERGVDIPGLIANRARNSGEDPYKKGGKVKKMQMGGALPVAASPEMMPKRRRMAKPMMAAKPMARPMAQPMMSKKGGKIETPAMHKSEMKKMGKVEKELKKHEGKPASKAHRGLKKGGAPKAGPDTMGGLAGGISATRVNPKKTTGGVRNSNAGGFKSGGHVAMKHGGMDGYKTGGKMCKY